MSHNLFLSKEQYSSEKLADVILSRDGEDWEEDVSENLHREHPYIQDKNINITITNKNPDQGVGVGSVKIDDKIMIPIVVDGFRMAPLDIFWKDGKLFPMTRDAVEEALQDTALGQPVSPGQGEMTDASTYGRTQPPFDGKYTYASHFDGLATPDEMRDAISSAFSDDGAVYELQSNQAMRDGVTSIASGHHKEAEELRNLTVQISGADDLKEITESGPVKLATAAGPVNGVIADYVIGLDGCPSHGRGMFIGFDKAASYSPMEMGHTVAGSTFDPSGCVDAADMRRGEAGVFFKVGSKGTVCTEVVTPKFQTGEGWAVSDGYGQSYTINKVAGVIVPTIQGSSVMIPDSWNWRPTATRAAPMPMAKAASINTATREFVYNNISSTVDVEKVASALKDAYEGCSVSVAVERVAAPASEIRVAPVNLFKEAAAVVTSPAIDTDFGNGCHIKMAAVEESQAQNTVDALLGLNFVTPENIRRFLDKMPILEEARDTIAKLLLASRLGLNADSRPLRTAMFSLDTVIRDLQEVRHETEGYDLQ